MSFDQADFDPTKAPAKEDIVSRGVRLGTAATVIAAFYSSAPTTGMIDNFFNPELLEVWPLRDDTSMSGVEQLLSGHDHQGPLRSDWLSLYGYDAIACPSETQRGADTSVQQTLGAAYSAADFASIQAADVPTDHIGAELAFSGHLATMAAMTWRDGEDLTRLGHQLRDFVGDHLAPLAEGVVADTEQHANTLTYKALVPLTRGYLAELRSFADFLATGK